MSEFTSTDPAEVLSERPHGPTREQTMKTVQEKYPGHISWASDRANFAGCRIVTFMEGGAQGLTREDELVLIAQMKEKDLNGSASPEEIANLYFSTRANLLVVDMKVSADTITMLLTTQLDEEDLEEFVEVNTRVQLGMREWREEKAKQREAEQEKAREILRLAEVGRKYEANVKKEAPRAV